MRLYRSIKPVVVSTRRGAGDAGAACARQKRERRKERRDEILTKRQKSVRHVRCASRNRGMTRREGDLGNQRSRGFRHMRFGSRGRAGEAGRSGDRSEVASGAYPSRGVGVRPRDDVLAVRVGVSRGRARPRGASRIFISRRTRDGGAPRGRRRSERAGVHPADVHLRRRGRHGGIARARGVALARCGPRLHRGEERRLAASAPSANAKTPRRRAVQLASRPPLARRV